PPTRSLPITARSARAEAAAPTRSNVKRNSKLANLVRLRRIRFETPAAALASLRDVERREVRLPNRGTRPRLDPAADAFEERAARDVVEREMAGVRVEHRDVLVGCV